MPARTSTDSGLARLVQWSAATKLTVYAVVLAAALGGGALVGAATGPVDVGTTDERDDGHDDTGAGEVSELPAGGLLVSQDGYTFVPEERVVGDGTFAFVITGPDGDPVRSFAVEHERELHLIVASRDLRQFLHVHPHRDPAGRWTIDLPPLPAGAYRAYADFRATGAEPLTLGVDVVSPGPVEPPRPLEPSRTDDVGGYEVALDGQVVAGTSSEVAVTVTRDGAVVRTEPYLGAGGHLVALRDGDLAYLHVHPVDDDGASVRFAVEVPSPGTYALFFDFQLDGEVHTARFVVEATPGATTAGTDDAPPRADDGHD